MSPKDYLRLLVSKLPAGLLVLVAFGGFWVLKYGFSVGRGTIIGYAEEQVHNLAPLQAGRLQAVKVQLGQLVRAGEVVALLDSRPLELQRAQLQAELELAQAELTAQQDMQSARLQRGELQAVRTHSKEARARAELHELNRQVRRLKKLSAAHLAPADEFEAARERQHAVAADLKSRPVGTHRQLQLMGFRPRAAEEQEQRLQERLAPYRAALHVKKAALLQVEAAIAEMTLRAPVDGTVGAILQWPGDVVSASTPVVRIITTRPGHVVAYVPERQIRDITVGAIAKLRRVGLLSGTMRGQVVELAPTIEEIPLRARTSPGVPGWARRVVVKLEGSGRLLAGEAFHVITR